ncbi:MAG: arylsulfatase [Methylococcus sp.]
MWRKVMLGAGLGLFSLLAGMVRTAALAEVVAITDRTVLPLPEPQYPPITELDVRSVTPPPRFAVTAPADAPNVLIVLIDDFGFGQSSAFGGPIPMPTVERLARNGLRYNQFHTTAVCSATRMALLTGRNHHTGNMGSITETATGFPGNTGQRPNSVAPLAEMLRLNGYSTAAFGKYHETAPWEVSLSGPTDRWPTRSGFDKFYGFIGGETNQWAPLIYDGLTRIERPKTPGYHFMQDMTDQAIDWVHFQQALTPDKPFFMYFAPGATHAPHHVPQEWIAKFKGQFDQGWDKLREATLNRQKQLGIVPANTPLAPKPAAIQDWDQLSAAEKKLFARQMEVFAAYAAYTDQEIGRLIKAIEDMGEADNSLIFYVLGDNGASAEGGMSGMFNEHTYFAGVQESVADILKHYDQLGGPQSYNHYAAGWAVAGDTPFTWTKQVASSFGGTRNGLVVHWPRRIAAKGELRTQFHHVIDIAPTILEAAGLPEPSSVNGAPQTPIEGVSLAYTFGAPEAPTRHGTQYFEMMGNRAIYHDGWLAGTVHKAPWEPKPRAALAEDRWELYDTRNDFSLTNDLSQRDPERLKTLQALFMTEAARYHVLPIDDRGIERTNPKIAGRPDLMGDRTSLTLYEGMTGMSENVFINIKNRSHTITAELELPKTPANGVILAQAGRFGGWSLYLKKGKPVYTYNWLGLERYTLTAKQALPPGKTTLRFAFAYDGGLGQGGEGALYVNGQAVAAGRIGKTQPFIFSGDEGADVGLDEGTPVTEEYREGDNAFTGKIVKVTVEVGAVGVAERPAIDNAVKALAVKKALSD